MDIVDIHEAQRHFSELIEPVGEGEEILIANAGKPVVKLIPYAEAQRPKRKPGMWKGKVWMRPDFDKRDTELESLFYEGPINPAS